MPTLKVGGMSCNHCVQRVTKAIEAVPGASNVNVDLKSGTARFDLSDGTLEAAIKAVLDAGYQAEKKED